jgi:methylated-DNA-[protein]-cysteine S-methyltransferase
MIYSQTYSLPILGAIRLMECDGALAALELGGKRHFSVPDTAVCLQQETALLEKAVIQLQEYLARKRRVFDLPLGPQGTVFQRSVWQALCRIPYGQTRSYGQIAAAVAKPGGSRAVGMANNRNPLPVFIPCHRVIGANGKLVGYGGGLHIKAALLQLEGNIF